MKRPSTEYLQEKTWEEKAQENPLYGVMSHEEFVCSGAQPTTDDLEIFYARGAEMVSQWIYPWMGETNTSDEMKILEFGCGMGRLTNSVSKFHPPENVYGIDISPTMIMHAKKNTTSAVNYSVVGDDGVFPYQSNYFDRIYSYAVFQHIAQRSVLRKALNEIARVLKPGGRLKLNFEMVFPPPFENRLRQDTYAFERHYWYFGWKKLLGLPIWRVRRNHTNNWSGTRLGYRQLLAEFKRNGLELHGIVREPQTKAMIWFLGLKQSLNCDLDARSVKRN